MNYGQRFMTLYRRQEKEMQKSKIAAWGGLTNSCEKKSALKHNTCSCLRAFLCTCSFLDSLMVLTSWLSSSFYSNVTLSGFSQLPYLELKPSWTSSPIYTCIFSIPTLLYILPKHVLPSSILNSLSVYLFCLFVYCFYCLCLVSRLL